MADDLITPALKKPKGMPPKFLFVGVLGGLLITVAALAIFGTGGGKTAPQTQDSEARAKRTTIPDAEAAQVGQAATALVDANAKQLPVTLQGAGATRETDARLAAHAPASAPLAMAPLPAGSQPSGSKSDAALLADAAAVTPKRPPVAGGVPTASAPDPAEAARDVEVMNSQMTVFDESPNGPGGPAGRSGTSSQIAAVEREIADARAAQANGANPDRTAEEARKQADAITKQMNAQQERVLAQQGSASVRDQQFIKDFSDQRAQPGLRPARAESPRTVLEGTVIPAVLTRDLISDLPGVVTASVTRDVYDSLTSRRKLICKGSRLVGRYSNQIQNGQSRLLFAFSRLVLPDGSSFDLPGFGGSDQSGRSGVPGDVDNHYVRIFGASLVIGLLADRFTRPQATPQGQGAQRSATGEIMVDTATGILERFKSIPTTISIDKGTPINVEVSRDLIVPASGACS